MPVKLANGLTQLNPLDLRLPGSASADQRSTLAPPDRPHPGVDAANHADGRER